MQVFTTARQRLSNAWSHPQTQALRSHTRRLFTEHPYETGETYLQHLWFTARMSVRILLCASCLMVHGVLPFLFRKTTSSQIEKIYAILKKRIPKSRLESIDQNWQI